MDGSGSVCGVIDQKKEPPIAALYHLSPVTFRMAQEPEKTKRGDGLILASADKN